MSTLTNQELKGQLDLDLENRYRNRVLDTLLTIPAEYWGPVMKTVVRWIEEGAKLGTDKFLQR